MASIKGPDRRTLIDGSIFISISVVCLIEGYRLHVTANPNALSQELAPGYYVFALGLILLIAGIVHIVRNVADEVSAIGMPVGGAFTIGLAGIVAALVGYAILMTTIGYFVGTAFFFLAVFSIFKVRPWVLTIGLGLGLAGVFYGLFVVYLGIIFPRGLLF